MNGLIRASLRNPYAVTVMCLTLVMVGTVSIYLIPIDILPVFKSPAVQVLTFYGGMPAASVEKDITNRMERWTGQASGTARQESRSIVGASIVRSFFRSDVDPNGALTQVNSLALASVPSLPPGTLPPVVLPFDPTSTTPVCIVAVDSPDQSQTESILYDVGRYEVRNMIMSINGAVAPVVYGGKIRAVLAYLDRQKMQARGLSSLDVMNALDNYNVFLPTGDAKIGDTDYALDSNSLYDFAKEMGSIPLRSVQGNTAYLRDVASTEDASYIQTNVVRINGRREVYIPVFRQLGASTLAVVDTVRARLQDFTERLTRSGVDLKVVMDQSIYVRQSIASLVQEGVLGSVLCSLTILLFLGQWRMTAIAVLTLPISVLSAMIFLKATGNTVNVMTLAGLTLAIGPMVDSAIICLENTHRHLGLGASPEEAAFLGASEVAVPELIATLCTFLVLSPLALMPGMGEFLFRPMTLAVAFAMGSAYLLSRTLVPACSAAWLKPGHHEPGGEAHQGGALARAFARWEGAIDRMFASYARVLDLVLRHRVLTVTVAYSLLLVTLVALWPVLRREFFPEVDAGAFEISVRAPSGTRIERTEDKIAQVEQSLKQIIAKHDLQLLISEIGVNADWSAAYTPNSGPMDAIIRVQLTEHRSQSAQEYVHLIRQGLQKDSRFRDLEFAFDAGGLVRGAMNEGKSTPINVRVTGKNPKEARAIAERIQDKARRINGVVDARIIQRLDYPEYIIDVDRAKAADLGLTQIDVMKNVVAAFNSSIQFNKRNFWIDPVGGNQYFVGVQYPEKDIQSIETLLNIPITGVGQKKAIPLSNLITLRRTTVPTEVTHANIQPTMDLSMGVHGRDLGHVSDDVAQVIDGIGKRQSDGRWIPYDLTVKGRPLMKGTKVSLSGEYSRMQDTFSSMGFGLIGASILIYFLMVGLAKSWVAPLSIMLAVPLSLIGVLLMLFFTGTAVNVQSLLGFIFIVGINVSNAVLMTDFAQELRFKEGLTPGQAIRKSAAIRVRPVTMTAMAAFFAMLPGAFALERGSEANAPLARAILGGLLAVEPSTLFVLPCLYSLLVRDRRKTNNTETDGNERTDEGFLGEQDDQGFDSPHGEV
ncbi:efflux RND transporter permease subunit [Singulisphaera acidiphila]|uniref:Cation/multidrug efflux pump n=1 Tax=Singulisphaera acidiphila (strain ATCC BAA-1392 / DSM 18658 / VKM B-2454 / MOB10) TaxID=886293 RepID=L0D5M6_SINAD|nr:efflux RND transporter permease subunit [Singulisphaera acidiphila]AGA24562.1 cation/multidrug efflux pump [Singulisphaera acidiphila DSM 18658]